MCACACVHVRAALVVSLVVESHLGCDAHTQVSDALAHADVPGPARVVAVAALHGAREAAEQAFAERVRSMQCTVYCTVYCTVHCTVYCTVQCTM